MALERFRIKLIDVEKGNKFIKESYGVQHLDHPSNDVWESEIYDEKLYGEPPSEKYANEMLYVWLIDFCDVLTKNGVRFTAEIFYVPNFLK